MASGTVIPRIRSELKQNIDEKTRDSGYRFFKEEVKIYGVKTSIVTKLADKYFKELEGKSKKEVFALCEELLKSDYMEESFIAFEWAYRFRKDYVPEDFEVLESWLEKHVNNWAKCDTLCNHTIGSFVEKYPQYIKDLKRWSKSDNRWVRRASAVTLILPARKGLFLKDVFDISNSLLMDKDDLVQKGYGWMLKEAGKAHQKEVFDYVMKNKKVMPRTALRYAIEKFPKDLRESAMEK